MFEKLINIRLSNYLETNQLYNERQMGFRQGRSTKEAIFMITSMITAAREADREINIVQRDVSKAFDKVWHDGLQYKLINNYDLPDNLVRLLCNFITNREAIIKYKNKNSETFPLKSGVPQGSCLSPTLYAIYTNDLPPPEEKNETMQFADDVTNVITEPGTTRAAKRRLEASTIIEIEKINQYEKTWKIQTNVNKFTIVPIMRHMGNQGITLNNGINIQYKNKVNVLGLEIKRTGYAKGQENRIAQAKYQIRKIRRFHQLSTKTKSHLIKALILPILQYPITPTVTLSTTRIKTLQKIQNRAVRFATNVKLLDRIPTETLHRRLKLEPINITLAKRAIKIGQKINNYINHPMTNKIELLENYFKKTNQRLPSTRRFLNNIDNDINNIIPIY